MKGFGSRLKVVAGGTPELRNRPKRSALIAVLQGVFNLFRVTGAMANLARHSRRGWVGSRRDRGAARVDRTTRYRFVGIDFARRPEIDFVICLRDAV